jgi:hypothetical protein
MVDRLQEIISNDIKVQAGIAERTLKDAKALELAIKEVPFDSDRAIEIVKTAHSALLRIARELASNATATSNSAIEVISSKR